MPNTPNQPNTQPGENKPNPNDKSGTHYDDPKPGPGMPKPGEQNR